jgi:ATP-binding cassette subfamily B protein
MVTQMLKKLLGKEFIRVMAFMKPRIWRYAMGMLGMTAMSTGLSVAEAFALKYIMQATVDGQMSLFMTGIAIMVGSILIILPVRPIFVWMYNSCAQLTAAEIRLQVFRHVENLPVSYFEQSHSGDVIARMTNDTNIMIDIYTHKLRRFLAPAFHSAGAAIAMLVLDWRIGCVLIVFNFLAVCINLRFAKPIRWVSDSIQQNLGTMTEKLIDLLAGFSVIKLFHLERMMLDSYDTTNQTVTDLSLRRRHQEGLLDSTNFLLSMISNLGMVVVGSYLATNGITDFGNLLALINLQSSLNRSLLQAGSYLPQVQESLAGASRVFELLDEPAEPARYDLPAVEANGADVAIKNLAFSYEQRERVLADLNIEVKKGQIGALVGPSGSGKSTILKMLLGFYPPQSGSIIVKNQSIQTYTLSQLRDMIAYVPQDAYLFDGTIEENIRYGHLAAPETAVRAAAKAANAHSFIMEQPDGYQTIVGERGTKLSGTQLLCHLFTQSHHKVY